MAITSTQERPREVYRYQPVRCLRCADLNHDDRSLARYHRTASGRWPLGLAAVRLASRFVRVCSVHHRSFVLHPDQYRMSLSWLLLKLHRNATRLWMISTETPPPARPPESRTATKRSM